MNRFSIFILCSLLIATQATLNCCDKNTLAVSGAGKVQVDPDIVVFSVSVNAQGPTSAIALSKVNKLINQIGSILKSYGLPTANWTTAAVNLSPIYNYTNGTSYLIGQQASQSLEVTIGNLIQNKAIIGQIIISLSSVDSIIFNGLTFKNSDTKDAYRQARRAAVADAQSKAQQYASLGGLSLGKVRKVVDQNIEYYIPFLMDANFYSFQSKLLKIPFGKVSVSASVQIDWNLTS